MHHAGGSTFDPTASVAPITLIFQRFRGVGRAQLCGNASIAA
jgi:hypothetical protein